MRVEPPSVPARRPASAVPSITGLKLLPQRAEAMLLNISSTGLLAESSVRLLVGVRATVLFEGGFTPSLVGGRVVRSEVSMMGSDGRLRYHVAIEFDTPIPLDDETPDAAAGQAPPAARNRW